MITAHSLVMIIMICHSRTIIFPPHSILIYVCSRNDILYIHCGICYTIQIHLCKYPIFECPCKEHIILQPISRKLITIAIVAICCRRLSDNHTVFRITIVGDNHYFHCICIIQCVYIYIFIYSFIYFLFIYWFFELTTFQHM